MKLGSKKETANVKTIGRIRQAQLVTTYGSGAIADMTDYSIILGATDYWNEKSQVLREPNLEKILHVNSFKQPLVTEDDNNFPNPDVPAFRFPIMHFCPQCGNLMPYWGYTDKENGKKCLSCNKSIVPTRFVAACVNGHLEDFPYNWWVHKGYNQECMNGKDDNLKIQFLTDTGGLESILIICKKCGKKRSMAGSMSKDALRGYKCHGKRPWIGLTKEKWDPLDCNAPMRGVQRGASNLYYTVTSSALTIPPWSGRIQIAIDKKGESIKNFYEMGIPEKYYNEFLEKEFKELLDTGFCDLTKIKKEIANRFSDQGTESYSVEKLMLEEYNVLCKGNDDDPGFKAEKTEVSKYLEEYLSEVVLIKRLREVMALKGFRRIYPGSPDLSDQRFEGYHHEYEYVPLGSKNENWLPAIEMLGEGIFIKISEEKLLNWEEENSKRYNLLEKRLGNSHIGKGKFSGRYVLLHTLSHLLIRQLTIECGYSGASIKERIYSTYKNSDEKMAGILIYTSSSDSDGSLGGLVRNGLKEQFEKIFRNILQEAAWCSSDPICIESTGQGFNSLNYAACHACTLLPETCCEAANCLLDRASIVGLLGEHSIGFFGKLVYSTEDHL